jgi:hypothetical protein
VQQFCKYRLCFLGFGEAACRDVWGVEKVRFFGSDFWSWEAACRQAVRKVSPAHPLSVGVWYIDSARIWLVIHIKISDFLQIFLLNPNFLLAHRNRDLEVMDDGQTTPRGYANFNSYVKNLHILVFIPDRQTEKLIGGGLGN